MFLSVLSSSLAVLAACVTPSNDAKAPAPRGVTLNVRNHTGGVTTGELPSDMVLLEGGTFTMGVSQKAVEDLANRDNHSVFARIVSMYPDTKQEIGSFVIDRMEITNLQFKTYLEANGLSPSKDLFEFCWSYWSKGEKKEGIPPNQEHHPVRGVTQQEASACASWLGKRLPTEFEWEYAGRRNLKDERFFPWASKKKTWDGWDASKCANSSNSSQGSKGIQTYPVGSFDGDKTEDGVFDLCGNVAEWTSSPFDPYAGYEPIEVKIRKIRRQIRASFDSQEKVIRGGSIFGDEVTNSLVFRQGYAPGSVSEGLGFRCVMSLLPGLDQLRQAEHELSLLNSGIRGSLKYGSNDIATQHGQFIDPDRKIGTGSRMFGFTKAKKITSSLAKFKAKSVEEPILVGLFVTSSPVAEPALPAGPYAIYFKAAGESEAQKAAKKAAREAQKASADDEKKKDDKKSRKSGRKRSRDKKKAEDKDENKGEEEEAKEPTEEEKAAAAEAARVEYELERIGAVQTPRLDILDLPTDKNILILKNSSGDSVVWLPSNLDETQDHPTMFRYITGGAGDPKLTASGMKEGTNGDSNDLAEVVFTIRTAAGSRYPEFKLRLQFRPGAFQAIEPPAPEDGKKKKGRRSRR